MLHNLLSATFFMLHNLLFTITRTEYPCSVLQQFCRRLQHCQPHTFDLQMCRDGHYLDNNQVRKPYSPSLCPNYRGTTRFSACTFDFLKNTKWSKYKIPLYHFCFNCDMLLILSFASHFFPLYLHLWSHQSSLHVSDIPYLTSNHCIKLNINKTELYSMASPQSHISPYRRLVTKLTLPGHV